MINLDQIRKHSAVRAPQTVPVRPPVRTRARGGQWGRVLAGGILGLGLILGVWRLPAVGQPVGEDSCTGPSGCDDNRGRIGNRSCNSRHLPQQCG